MKSKILAIFLFLLVGGVPLGSQAKPLGGKAHCNCGKNCAHAQNCFGFKARCDHGQRK
ncbi:hypothetical protein EM20IM_06255 [Candidatus Methylacidiphilum infernorum]|uniref:Uncharacterized protein n=1 Tax=Candidatus Methylacidiphilum infernorum TaxID=511746 RepID=A0ABX7PT91_9BACT|nr:hypothetical protein [Candidatus Methylacidiphilum infernorum]QSR86112.1 hypothetical protein EM20IM_06255 [Candidatus Methylacidiphilum infernorum]